MMASPPELVNRDGDPNAITSRPQLRPNVLGHLAWRRDQPPNGPDQHLYCSIRGASITGDPGELWPFGLPPMLINLLTEEVRQSETNWVSWVDVDLIGPEWQLIQGLR